MRVPEHRKAYTYGGLPLTLVLTTSIQGLATLMVLALATLAPIASGSLGVGAEVVGYQISLIYTAAAIISSFSGAVVHRFGGCAISQTALLMGAIGCAGLTSGNLITVALASLFIGIAYGLTNPAASQLLNRVTPMGRRGIVFSIKQTGVPLGGVLAGLSLPALTVLIGWQGAVYSVAGIALGVALFMVPLRKHWDFDREKDAVVSVSIINGPVMVWGIPRLRTLSLMGFCFSAIQLSLMSFMVTLLVEDAAWGIIAAGAAAALVQAFGAGARIGWGALADKIGNGLPVLAVSGVITCFGCLVVTMLTPDWPDWLIIMTLSIFGIGAIGWNGVFLAEVVRSAPQDKIGIATGGALTFTFAGVVLGPSLYALLHNFFSSYSTTFLALAALPMVGVILLLREMNWIRL